jgi:hypothetical protein
MPMNRLEQAAAMSVQSTRALSRRVRARVEERTARLPIAPAGAVRWDLREASRFRGNVQVSGRATVDAPRAVTRVQVMDASDRFRGCAVNGQGGSFDFTVSVACGADEDLSGYTLRAVLDDGTRDELTQFVSSSIESDPYHALTRRFFELCRAQGEQQPSTVLEIGSRSRSGRIRREMVAPMEYVGLDVLEGENTDIVGDAHELSSLLPRTHFDAAFALSTFEHLAMPWKVVVELNRVLKPGAHVFIASHQAFPLHDAPWDYWRFSTSAWHALFNDATGFRILDTAMGESAHIVASMEHEVVRGLDEQPAFLASAVLAEKVAETTLDWQVDASLITTAPYPG